MSAPVLGAADGRADRPRRPARPRRSTLPWLAGGLVVAITVWACLPKVGIDADVVDMVRHASNAGRIGDQLLHPHLSYWHKPLGPLLETIEMAVMATSVGAALALPISFLASGVTNPSRVAVGVVRAGLSVLRSIPDLLFAALFVTIVGVGALPGVLALVLFTIGIVVKLTSEVVDAADPGPIEAARSTGATWFATSRAAVLPQVLPSYTSVTLYVFELNVRASTVLGLVGAGGLGDLINSLRKFYRYDDLAVVILEILVVVVVLESLSQALRRRLG